MENLPRDENDDVKKQIIRTTIKNENLLAKKMEMDKIKKKSNKKLSHSLKHKSERSTKVEGVLATKIQQSIEKARYVQTARKSNWDLINKNIVIRNDLLENKAKNDQKISEKEAEKRAEEEYVKLFFESDKKDETAAEEPTEPAKETKSAGNIYAMLEETDC